MRDWHKVAAAILGGVVTLFIIGGSGPSFAVGAPDVPATPRLQDLVNGMDSNKTEVAGATAADRRELQSLSPDTPTAPSPRDTPTDGSESATKAASVFLSDFSDALPDADWSADNVAEGGKLLSFLDDYTARIELPNGHKLLADSTVPLRTQKDGKSEPVNLQLEDTPNGFAPIEPITPTQIPDRLDEGITLGSAGVRIYVDTQNDDHQGRLTDDGQVFYPDVANDSDEAVTLTPTSLETFTQMRSVDSPRIIRYRLALPDGASLHKDPDGGASIVRDESTIMQVAPPTAIDADGKAVPTHMDVHGDELAVITEPSEATRMPVLVDPAFYVYESGSLSAWHAYDSTAPSGGYSYYPPAHGCNVGLYPCLGSGQGASIWAYPGSYPMGSFGEWYYSVPANGAPSTAFISRADYALAERRGSADTGRIAAFESLWAASTGWQGIQGQDGNYPYLYGVSVTTSQTNATQAVFGLYPQSSASRGSWAWGYLDYAFVYLDDTDAPVLNSVTHTNAPTAWVNHAVTDTVTGNATDGGLGVRSWSLWSSAGPTTQVRACAGSSESPCSHISDSSNSNGANSFTYTASVDGDNVYSLGAYDPTAKGNDVSNPNALWHIKIDRASPLVQTSGGFTQQVSDGEIAPGSYPVSVDAEDLVATPDETPVDGTIGQRSGVKSVQITIDGAQVYYDSQTCPQGNCAMQRSWTFSTAAYQDGKTHTAKVMVADQANNVDTDQWRFRVTPSAGGAAQSRMAETDATVNIQGAGGGDNAGYAVADAGDVNSDGIGDYAVGAPGADTRGRTDNGAVYVIYGQNASRTLDLSNLAASDGFRIDGAVSGDFAGTAVEPVGDVNGDGYPDLAIGAPGLSPQSTTSVPAGTRGAVYVVLGKEGPVGPLDLASMEVAGYKILGPTLPAGSVPGGASLTARGFGSAISASPAGTLGESEDVNGDGLADMVIGSSLEQGGAGAGYVIFGHPAATDIDVGNLGTLGYRIAGTSGDRLGYAASLIDDMTDDGHPEVALTAPTRNATGRTNAGSIFVTFGRSDTSPLSVASLGAQGFMISGAGGDAVGLAVSNAEDANGDGYGDIVIGGKNATIISGQNGTGSVDMAAPATVQQTITTSAFGSADAVGIAPDADGDSTSDVVVGDSATTGSGSAAIVFANPGTASVNMDALTQNTGVSAETSTVGQDAGTSVAAIDDARGVSATDLLVGAPEGDPQGRADAGVAYLVPGVPRYDCSDSLPDLGHAYSYMCDSTGSLEITNGDGSSSSYDTDSYSDTTDFATAAAEGKVGRKVNSRLYRWGPISGDYGLTDVHGRPVSDVGRVRFLTSIDLNGMNSYAHAEIAWKRGPAIRQYITQTCKRNRRDAPDAVCATGSLTSNAPTTNKGNFAAPARPHLIVKENVKGNQYFYEYTMYFGVAGYPNPVFIALSNQSERWSCKDRANPCQF
jgi:hypothetical protein